MVASSGLSMVYRGGFLLGLLLNRIMSPVIMSLVYYLVVAPLKLASPDARVIVVDQSEFGLDELAGGRRQLPFLERGRSIPRAAVRQRSRDYGAATHA